MLGTLKVKRGWVQWGVSWWSSRLRVFGFSTLVPEKGGLSPRLPGHPSDRVTLPDFFFIWAINLRLVCANLPKTILCRFCAGLPIYRNTTHPPLKKLHTSYHTIKSCQYLMLFYGVFCGKRWQSGGLRHLDVLLSCISLAAGFSMVSASSFLL